MAEDALNPEAVRIAANDDGRWWRWGPYLAERQWGTVREDYSVDGEAWEYFPHDHARSRAYRWGEDGLAGWSDENQRICLSLALWNGVDPFLKERLFGLTNHEGNHGEDVKELYYYLDATPSHSYLRMLYKYPQAAFPYQQLRHESARRGTADTEYELADTGVFHDGRYFDVVVEYAKDGPDDTLMRVTATNRGPDPAPLHLLPQVTLRNTWSWDATTTRPQLSRRSATELVIRHSADGDYQLVCDGAPEVLVTENESNRARLWGQIAAEPTYCKDAFHDWLVGGRTEAVNPAGQGTKAAFAHAVALAPGESAVVRLRLRPQERDLPGAFQDFDALVARRRAEADTFYDSLAGTLGHEERRVQRQAYAGLIWNKQFYHFNVRRWLEGDPAGPPPPAERRQGRDSRWRHLDACEVLSVPDAWEFPWFASWDLAFHAVPLARLDPAFAKRQLDLLTREWYLHPNGQLPAYEWAFGDALPPVHAWAAWRVFEIDRAARGDGGDVAFLERVFHKLLLNFTWWVNREDPDGRNIFQGGFLGLDNIGVFDRDGPLPAGGRIAQADGTSWMAMYSLNLLRIALELSRTDAVYQDIATKFFEHFLAIAEAMTTVGGGDAGLWDPVDEFYYDELHLPDGTQRPLRLRSMVGLIPLCAVEVLDAAHLDAVPDFTARLDWVLAHRPDLAALVSHWNEPGHSDGRLLSLLRGHRMTRLLARMLDESEFLSPHGIRAMSRDHLAHPFELAYQGQVFTVRYEPGESASRMYGGNSNWRGPVWFPVNYLLIESLRRFQGYYGDGFQVECPTGSGLYLTLAEVAAELTARLIGLFLPDATGRRPFQGPAGPLADDPHFRDQLLFHEYFDGDTGRGLGASHQTGWTALVAELLYHTGHSTAETSAPPRTTRRAD
jgi:hypothetical protein